MTVSGVNDAPVLSTEAIVSFNEGSSTSIAIIAYLLFSLFLIDYYCPVS